MNFADEDGSGEAIEMEEKSKSSTMMIEREHMFDKVVTPSDVGKLNRLVIPKQHAEKYFPLDSTVNEKGLLLNFEDGTGKPWRFRYSYWNSSQSYVMTKGWSRFVKEKKLDAGDIVSFQRGVGVGDEFGRDKLFIDWRRRLPTDHGNSMFHRLGSHGRVGGNCVPTPGFVLRSYPHPHPHPLQMQPGYPYPQVRRPGLGVGSGCYGYPGYPVTGSVIFLRSTSSATGMITSANTNTNTTREEEAENVYESVPVVQGKAEAKRLRLFGVNMECTSTPISNQAHDFDILSSSLAPSSSSSSTTSNHHHHHQHNTTTGISIGPPSSSTNTLRSFFNGTSSEKGKSSTSSSSMSLDLDI